MNRALAPVRKDAPLAPCRHIAGARAKTNQCALALVHATTEDLARLWLSPLFFFYLRFLLLAPFKVVEKTNSEELGLESRMLAGGSDRKVQRALEKNAKFEKKKKTETETTSSIKLTGA